MIANICHIVDDTLFQIPYGLKIDILSGAAAAFFDRIVPAVPSINSGL